MSKFYVKLRIKKVQIIMRHEYFEQMIKTYNTFKNQFYIFRANCLFLNHSEFRKCSRQNFNETEIFQLVLICSFSPEYWVRLGQVITVKKMGFLHFLQIIGYKYDINLDSNYLSSTNRKSSSVKPADIHVVSFVCIVTSNIMLSLFSKYENK